MECSGLGILYIYHQGCLGMCLTRFAHLDLKFPIFFIEICMLRFFYRIMHIATCNMHAICILQCNIDSFLLNQKGLKSMSILHKKFCNMHIACRNMHIAIESILPLTHAQGHPPLRRHGFIKSTPLEGQAAPPPL